MDPLDIALAAWFLIDLAFSWIDLPATLDPEPCQKHTAAGLLQGVDTNRAGWAES